MSRLKTLAMKRATERDAGITLAELMVAMMILGLVLALASTLVTASVRQYRLATGKVDSQADARQLTEMLTRDLRVAVPNPGGGASTFSAATATSMTFFTSRQSGGGAPLRVTYAVDSTSGCMSRAVTKGTQSGSVVNYGAAPAATCVAPGRVDTSLPIFRYYTVDGTGTELPELTGTDPITRPVAHVNLRFAVTSPQRPEIAPTTVKQTVTLINQTTKIQGGNAK